jgi:hypothetical protein
MAEAKAGAAPVRTSSLSLTATAPPPRVIDMQLENTLPPGMEPTFEVGEQIFVSATVSRTSHMYCYFADAGGNVMRLTPNMVTPHSLVAAHQAVRLPDWLVPNPAFIMDASRPGTERVACFASESDAMPRLPAPLQGWAKAATCSRGCTGRSSPRRPSPPRPRRPRPPRADPHARRWRTPP